jgi:lupus La protein
LEYWQEIKRRTVYVKGFPLDTPLDEILEFVGKFGTVKNVLMRRTKPGRVFKGSIFATFTDRETAEKFVKNEETKQFKGNDLTKLMQDEYWVRKTKETKERRLAEKSVKSTMKQQAVEEQKKSALGSHFIKGLVLNVHGLPKEGKATVNKLKEFFNQFSEVAYVVYEENQDDAQIRFKSATENAAMEAWEKALAKHNGEVLFEGAKITAELLSGEEEEKYWADFTKQKVVKDNRKQNARFGNRRGGGRGGGGGRNNKRRGDENDDDKAKKSKRTVFKDEEENAAPKEEAVKEEA